MAKTHLNGLPLSDAEYQRRKANILDESGMFIDVYDDKVDLSIGAEVHAKLSRDAARLGLDVETYIRQVWQEQVDRIRAGKKR